MTICVNCGAYIPGGKLYIKYNNNSYKLLNCTKCGKIIDKYIEYDHLNLLISIILLKKGVYRHMVYNADNMVSNRRLKYIILSFEVYITWVYQEHFNSLLVNYNSSSKFLNQIISSTGIIDAVFKLNGLSQYFFFIIYCSLDQWLMLKLVNMQFAKNLYLEGRDSKYSLVVFENTLLLSYISRLIFPILMLIWPYDDSIIIPSFIIKWLTNYYLIESVNLILYKKSKFLSFNNLILIFVMIFVVKIFVLNLIMNLVCFASRALVKTAFKAENIDIDMMDKYRFMKDLFYQLALG